MKNKTDTTIILGTTKLQGEWTYLPLEPIPTYKKAIHKLIIKLLPLALKLTQLT